MTTHSVSEVAINSDITLGSLNECSHGSSPVLPLRIIRKKPATMGMVARLPRLPDLAQASKPELLINRILNLQVRKLLSLKNTVAVPLWGDSVGQLKNRGLGLGVVAVVAWHVFAQVTGAFALRSRRRQARWPYVGSLPPLMNGWMMLSRG